MIYLVSLVDSQEFKRHGINLFYLSNRFTPVNAIGTVFLTQRMIKFPCALLPLRLLGTPRALLHKGTDVPLIPRR